MNRPRYDTRIYPRLRRAVLHPSLVLKDADDVATMTADESFIEVKDLLKSYVDMNEQSTQSKAKSSGSDTPKTNGESSMKVEGNNAYAEDVLANLGQEEMEECPICMDVMQSPVLVPQCMHQRFVHCMFPIDPAPSHSSSMQLQRLYHRIPSKVHRGRERGPVPHLLPKSGLGS
jgi:hypothetical protein